MINMANVPLIEAIRMITKTPARIMKVENKKGSLEKGKDADILIFDEDVNIKMTMVKGKIIHESK
jgi:N-acetylglucosamine-6-phosphate deacetylase